MDEKSQIQALERTARGLPMQPWHRRQEFLAFLKQVARAYPDQQLHLVMDNYATHRTPEVKQWLAENPRFQVHFTRPPRPG